MTELFRFPDLAGLLQSVAPGPLWLLVGVFAVIALYHLVVSTQTQYPAMAWLGMYSAALGAVLLTPLDDQLAVLSGPWQRVASVLLALGPGCGVTVAALQLRPRSWLRVGLFAAYGLLVAGCALVIGMQWAGGYTLPYREQAVTAGLLALPILNAMVAGLGAWSDRKHGYHRLLLLGWLTGVVALPLVWLEAPNQAGHQPGGWLLLAHILLLAFALSERVNMLRAQLRHVEAISAGQRALFGRVEQLAASHIHAALGATALLRAAPRREYLGIVERSVQGLLRDMSIAEANAALARGERFTQRDRIDLRQMASHVLGALAPLANARRLVLYGIIDPALPQRAHADLRHIQCLLSMALEQGLRNCSGGEVVLRIDADADRPSTARFALVGVQAAVTGGWRDAEAQDWMRRMSAALGGRQGLNTKGSRLELWLQLPVFEPLDMAAPAPETVAELEPGRVLVVDAHEAFRSAAAAILRNLGHEVDAAASVDDAIAVHAAAATVAADRQDHASLVADPAGAAPLRRDWLWDNGSPGGAVAQAEVQRAAGDRSGPATAPRPVRYDRLLIGGTAQERDDSPVLIDRLRQAGISASNSVVMLPGWQLPREPELAAVGPPVANTGDGAARHPVGADPLESEPGIPDRRPALSPDELIRAGIAREAIADLNRDVERRRETAVEPQSLADVLKEDRLQRERSTAGSAPDPGFGPGSGPAAPHPPAPDRTVWIHRPLLVSALAAELVRTETPAPASVRGLRAVLAVADEELAAVLAGLLQSLGCKVSSAENGRLLLHRYTRGRHGLIPGYDLVILEGSDEGRATAQQIREFEASRGPYRVCIVALTRPGDLGEQGGEWSGEGVFDSAVALPLTQDRLRPPVYRAARIRARKDASDAGADLPI